MHLNINENGVNGIWMVVNILIHLLTEILAYCKALKVKISVHSNFPYRFTHSVIWRPGYLMYHYDIINKYKFYIKMGIP